MAGTRHLLVTSLLLLVAWATQPTCGQTSAPTANSQHPHLLPADCGRRQVAEDEVTRPFIIGPGNTTAYYGKFPWQARIVVYKRGQQGYQHQCGGIIIAARYILTAAHCVVNVGVNQMLVRVGDLRFDQREESEQEFAVASIRVHHQYSSGAGLPNDVALLRLRLRIGPGIRFDRYVTPACLPTPDLEYETFLPCEVSGWGKTGDHAPISEVLRGITVPLVSDDYCNTEEVYRDRFLPGRMFCSGPVGGGTDSCGGDSGGPLVCQSDQYNPGPFVAYGIVSNGDPVGCGKRPGLYAKVSAYIHWVVRRLQLDVDEELELLLAETHPAPSPPPPTASPEPPTQAECGRISFVPPAEAGAARVTDASHFPWIVTINIGNIGQQKRCGGVIVSDRWILTAGICAGETRPRPRVRFGDPTPDQGADDSRSAPPFELDIVDAVMHPKFDPADPYSGNDIALLKTKSAIPFSNTVSPICLTDVSYPSSLSAGNDLIFNGFGGSTVSHSHPWALKWSRMRVVDKNECGNKYSDIQSVRNFTSRDDIFCTSFVQPSGDFECGVVAGDSGTVFMDTVNVAGVDRWHAVGMTVAGIGCDAGPFPDINTALATKAAWIRSVVGLPDPVPVPACGRTTFSPPSETSARTVRNAANFPWSAAVYQVRSEGVKMFVCGGAVVSDRWILTAATCVQQQGASALSGAGKHATMSVRLQDVHLQDSSDDNPTSPPFDLDIVKVVQHPEYTKGQNVAQDMALLKTKTTIPFSSTLSPICLPKPSQTSAVATGNTLIFAGWGGPKLFDNTSPLALKWARLKVVDQASCRANYTNLPGSSKFFGAGSFCTKFASTEAFECGVSAGDQGSVFMDVVDEGGVKTWYAAGLTVGGKGCGSEEYPDVNIALAPSIDWVSSVIAMG